MAGPGKCAERASCLFAIRKRGTEAQARDKAAFLEGPFLSQIQQLLSKAFPKLPHPLHMHRARAAAYSPSHFKGSDIWVEPVITLSSTDDKRVSEKDTV
jgi:hypothetical protein